MASKNFNVDSSTVHVRGRGAVPTDESGGGEPDADPQLQAGIGFSTVNVQRYAALGEEVQVSGEMFLDCFVTITPVATRLKVTVPSIGYEETINTGKLGCGDSATFSTSFTVPESKQDVTVVLDGQVNPPGPITGYVTRGTSRNPISVVPEGEKQQAVAINFAPYVVGGGGLGYALGKRTGRSPATTALAGAAGGAALKQYGNRLPSFSKTIPGPYESLAYAALLGAGAWLLTSTQDITGVGEGPGGVVDAASRVGGAARSAVSGVTSRVGSR